MESVLFGSRFWPESLLDPMIIFTYKFLIISTEDQIFAESTPIIPASDESDSLPVPSMRSKPGPKPQWPSQIPQAFRGPLEWSIKTHSREEKLDVLEYWKYRLVADEKQGVEYQCPVTLPEVSLRYKVSRRSICLSTTSTCLAKMGPFHY